MTQTNINHITNDWFKILVQQTFFTVTFLKKDGSLRVMNARIGAKKFASPTAQQTEAQRTAAQRHNQLTVTDLQKDAPRRINCNTILEIKARGLHIKRDTLSQNFIEL